MGNEVEKQAGGVGLAVGSKIGKYQVVERLGIGGQAIVYKCHDPMLDRFVAVKQISTHLAEDPRFLERFRKEAQILARLGTEQSAIVTIYELIEEPLGLFIVMEYVAGSTLETLLKDNPAPMEPKAALQLIWRLAAALHAVHSAGIIHRDIKPGNIIVGEGLRAKITDFGVAASASGQTSMLLGTTKYMAPELFSSGPIDGRADMYSLGFIAYEMLVGRQKFQEIFAEVIRDRHSESLRWMKWHGNEQVTAPPLHEVNASIPAALSQIVARMMAKKVSDRFESMEALGRAIKSSFSPRGKAATAARPVAHKARAAHAGAGVKAASERDEALAVDEDEDLEVPRDATAPLPKPKLSLRTKIILLGVVITAAVSVGVVVLVRMSGIEQAKAHSAAGLFDNGWDAYQKQGDYAKAVAKFDELRKKHPGTPQSRKASAILPLCEAYLAVEAKDWPTANAKRDIAARNLQELARTEDLAGWAGQFNDDVAKFSEYLNTAWKFSLAMDKARDLVKQKKLTEALDALEGDLGKLELTPQQQQQLASLKTQIHQIDVMGRAGDAIKAGIVQTENKQYGPAEKAFADAKAILESKDAESLAPADLEKFKADLATARRKLDTEGAWEVWMVRLAAARTKNDPAAIIDALEHLIKIKPDPAMQAEIVQLKTTVKFDEIKKGINPDNVEASIAKLKAFLQEYPGHPDAQALLDGLLKNRARTLLISAGDGFFEAKEWAKALEKYQAAAAIQFDANVDKPMGDKMSTCQFQIGLAAANKLADAKQYPEANQAYDKLKQEFPAHAPEVEAIQAKMRSVAAYEDKIKRVKEEIARRNFGDAKKILGQIKPATIESLALLDKVLYEENMRQGRNLKDSDDLNDLNGAMGYFKIARTKAHAPEEIKDVTDAITEVEIKIKNREPAKPPSP